MATLEREEIFEELRRLGIHNPLERAVYFNEYTDYFEKYNDSLIKRLSENFRRSLKYFTNQNV